MSKEIWIEKFDELISEYENDHPEATYEEAVAYAEAMIDGRYGDTLGDMIDAARMRAKYADTPS